MILTGRDTMTGGSIIMPIDISTAATMMSITRKGRSSMKPISKARFSSEMRKAGASVVRGVSARVFGFRSEEHTSELQSLMRISYAVFCLKKKTQLDELYSQI